jgi:beta-glucosidase
MKKNVDDRRFPKGFVWGVATSAFQIEGGAPDDGRGKSIWDKFCEVPGVISDNSDGRVACDHYHRLEEDLDLMEALGVAAYRFSISWPRVQPDGRGNWNQKGLDFYDRLLAGLKKRGIAAFLTLYHWDLPQALQEHGGWGNRETALLFAQYARVIAQRYGNSVASIATHNEPWVVAMLGHESGIFAPGIKSRKAAMQVAHHLLLSHGLAVQAIRELGVTAGLGIVLNLSSVHTATGHADDVAKAKIEDGMLMRWYLDPLLRGCYPADVWEHLGEDIPRIEHGDMDIIHSPIDFLGVNYYTRVFISHSDKPKPDPGPLGATDMGWEVYPEGLTELLTRLHRDYALPPVYITENGAAYQDQLIDSRIADEQRITYLRTHISAMADAIAAGVDVRGYFVWSLFDNFEWAFGYSKRFGIVYVDYANGNRIPKDSALWYRDFIAQQLHSKVAKRKATGD